MGSNKRRRKPGKPAGQSRRTRNVPGTGQPTEGDVGQLTKALLDDTAAQARLVLAGAAVLGSLRTDTRYPERPDHDDAPVPFAIIETPTTIRVPLPDHGGRTYDIRAAIAMKLGLHPLGATTATVPPAPNWRVEYGKPSTLLDPTGTAVATFTVPDDPEWLRHARRHGSVAVIYGTNVGVKRPGTVPPWMYDDTARAAELQTSRLEGAVTCGLVAFAIRPGT